MTRRRSPGDPPRSNIAWTPDEEDRLRSLWIAGRTDEDIACQLGRTRLGVVSRRERLGVGKLNQF